MALITELIVLSNILLVSGSFCPLAVNLEGVTYDVGVLKNNEKQKCKGSAVFVHGNGNRYCFAKKKTSQNPVTMTCASPTPLEFDDVEKIQSLTYKAGRMRGCWISDKDLYWVDQGKPVIWDIVENKAKEMVMEDLTFVSKDQLEGGKFSQDMKLFLYETGVREVWRYSYTAKYMVYNRETKSHHQVVAQDGATRLQYCNWAPINENKTALVYVSNNNIYWRDKWDGDSSDNDVAITKDGLKNVIFNGILDWIYEEEIVADSSVLLINKKASKLCFVQFNGSLVHEYEYPMYGEPRDVLKNQYPEYKVIRYPKAGEVNPTIKVFARNIGDKFNKEVVPPDEVKIWGEIIIRNLQWTGDDMLCATWSNRVQNESLTAECTESGEVWTCKTVFVKKQESGWVTETFSTKTPHNQNYILKIVPMLQPGVSLHYKQILKIDKTNKEVNKFLTSGAAVVTEILSWDLKTGLVYFMGTGGSPGSRHFFTVDDAGERRMDCITCRIKMPNGSTCNMSEILMNQANTHYVHVCTEGIVPQVMIRQVSDHSIVQILNTREKEKLKHFLKLKQIPTAKYLTIELPGKFIGHVEMVLPVPFDPTKKYPMIVNAYCGPGSQSVNVKRGLGFGDYLATKGIIYTKIDGRGTGFQSDEHMFEIYKKLGQVEVEDQKTVVRKLGEIHGFIDKEKVGIWGWSYGGFVTTMALEKDMGPDSLLKCGIAVAPVTSWLLYDSIYTERFMGLPKDNEEGYNHSAFSSEDGLNNLNTKKFMLVHGMADDNVHFQNSMLLTRALFLLRIDFVQHFFPNEKHSLETQSVYRYLLHAMDEFWEDCFE